MLIQTNCKYHYLITLYIILGLADSLLLFTPLVTLLRNIVFNLSFNLIALVLSLFYL